MEDIMGKILTNTEELVANVSRLADAVEKATGNQATGRQNKAPTKWDEEVEQAMPRIFDELYDEDPDGEVTRAEILAHFGDCENDEICQLIERFDLRNCHSKGYRAFIDYARSRSTRERNVQGGYLALSGISMKTVTYAEALETTDNETF